MDAAAASRAASSRADAFIAAAHTDSHAPGQGDATAAHAAVSSATAAFVASAASAFGAPAACRSSPAKTVSPHVGRDITDGGAAKWYWLLILPHTLSALGPEFPSVTVSPQIFQVVTLIVLGNAAVDTDSREFAPM